MNIYVIGGGAAGMMSAICAARQGHRVTLLEKNEKCGKKLFITGKGRCNLTNASSVQNVIDNTVRNGKFLFGALRAFDSQACMEFFEKLGVPLKTERGNRVFPVSDKSSDVIRALTKELERLNVSIHLQENVLSLDAENGKIVTVTTNKGQYRPDHVILATGGITYPTTGSTGDGLRFAQETGHTVIDPVPSLCDVIFSEPTEEICGLSLKNVRCSIKNKEGKTIAEEFGEMLFTEKGAGGPCTLSLSTKICRMDVRGFRYVIDLKPALDDETLDKRLLRDFQEQQNKEIKNALFMLLPKSLCPVVLRKSGISPEKKCNALTKEERKKLMESIRELSFHVEACEKNRAVITSGGVTTKEIDPRTMRSKLYDNLSFAGEMIDVDAMTGGYNLQIAFATGYAAGNHIQ